MHQSRRVHLLTLGQRLPLPNRPVPRLRKWLAGGVAVLWILLILSHIFFLSVRVDRTVVNINYGRVAWVSNAPRLPPMFRHLEQPVRLSYEPGIRIRFDWWEQTGMHVLEAPLWPAMVLATSAFLFWSARQRAISGDRCRSCGYDWAGLPDPAAPCPECGAAR